MSDLIDTTEMYLKTIFELEEDGVVPLRARIAERLGHSGPTVSQTVARMERDGLLTLDGGDRHLVLTGKGRLTAMRVMRKHRLAERLLVDVLGVELPFVHEEACRWEHVMSERVESHILALISDPTRSPYGNVVPGLDELGHQAPTSGDAGPVERPLLEAATELPQTMTVVRVGEPAQIDPEVVALLVEAGVVPGAEVEAGLAQDDRVVVAHPGQDAISLPPDLAQHVFVRA